MSSSSGIIEIQNLSTKQNKHRNKTEPLCPLFYYLVKNQCPLNSFAAGVCKKTGIWKAEGVKDKNKRGERVRLAGEDTSFVSDVTMLSHILKLGREK